MESIITLMILSGILIMVLYFVIGIVWGHIAVEMHKKQNSKHIEPWRLSIIYMINFSFWPITMIIAIFKYEL